VPQQNIAEKPRRPTQAIDFTQPNTLESSKSPTEVSNLGDMVVGENNLNAQIANLRRILGPEAIVTVPRRGLRFALQLGCEPPALTLPDRPSVVVLPFSTFGGDPDLDWLADGFVEDITTELSRFRDLFVVARNSAFVYRQMPRDLREIARNLGVRYVVEGSVRATPARVRVTA